MEKAKGIQPSMALKKVNKGGAPKGNRSNVKHDLYSTKTGYALRSRRVRVLVRNLYAVIPWLCPSDMSVARAWADLEHKLSTVSADLDRRGLCNEAGEPRRLLSEYRGLLSLQLAYSNALGLNPTARAGLRVDSLHGDSLSEEMQRARRDGK